MTELEEEEMYVTYNRSSRAPQTDPTQAKGLNFVVLDVEIATPKYWTICQLAVCVVENGKIIEQKCWLIQPPNNEYGHIQSGIHGIRAHDTKWSPTFKDVWAEIREYYCGTE
jgi:DNA polymerase III subunit epsilon